MTPTSARLDELRQRLVALRTRFGDVGARAATAADEVGASIAPAEGLVEELRTTAADFDGLRHAIVDELSAFPNTPDPTKLSTLKALDAVLSAMEHVHAEQARRAGWEAARDEARALLERVTLLVHREDPEWPALRECQTSARELYDALEAAPAGDPEQLGAHVRPFVELITLTDGWNRLDDEDCAALQDAITQSFGRPLALAAVRGKLGRQDEIVDEPRFETAPATQEVAIAPAPEPAIPAAPPEPAPVPVAMAAPYAPTADTRPAPPTPVEDERRAPPPGSPLVVEIRLSGPRVQVETAEERRERQALLERLATEEARWWIGARTGWESLVQRGLSPADAMRDALTRFPYLFSVPLSRSDEFEDGRLAEGYAILLQRLEKDEPGFVKETLGRLKPQLSGRTIDATYPIAQELYLYVVAEGRLYKTFPELLRDALVHALPEPGLWLQGSITDSGEATTIVSRPEQPGARQGDSRTLTHAAERFTTHAFSVATGPLTARVFSVEASELPDAIDVEIKLKENDAVTDHAWIVVAPMSGKPEAPRKHRAGGTKIGGLGKEHRAIWIAAFNSDPNADRSYELSVGLTRKAPTPTLRKPEPQQAAPSSSGGVSPFRRR